MIKNPIKYKWRGQRRHKGKYIAQYKKKKKKRRRRRKKTTEWLCWSTHHICTVAMRMNWAHLYWWGRLIHRSPGGMRLSVCSYRGSSSICPSSNLWTQSKLPHNGLPIPTMSQSLLSNASSMAFLLLKPPVCSIPIGKVQHVTMTMMMMMMDDG